MPSRFAARCIQGIFLGLFTIMEHLSKSGRIPSDLIPTAIAWGQGMASAIEALFDPDLQRERPPEGGPSATWSGYVPGRTSALPVILT